MNTAPCHRPASGNGRRLLRTVQLAVLAAALLCPPHTATAALLSKKDTVVYRKAFDYAKRDRWRWAGRLAGKARERLPAKILQWLQMTRPGNAVPFATIRQFIRDNPDWPKPGRLRRSAEEAISAKTPGAEVLAWFAKYPPRTTDGKIAMTAALMDAGRRDEARAMARRTWIEGNFGRRQQRRFIRRYRKMLTRDDHMARLDRLLWRGRHRQARRMMRRVDKAYHPVVIARIRLRRSRGGVDWAIRRVPVHLQNDPGFLYERARWRRRKGRDAGALEILVKPVGDKAFPGLWWRERAAVARRLLVKGQVTDAYKVVRGHGLSSGRLYAEAEWFVGWIALRFLHDRKDALAHFERLFAAVSYPISRARAAYWAGRAADALGRMAAAHEWYDEAAKYDATYYGQLAALQRNGGRLPRLQAEPRPGGVDIARFNRHELVRAVQMLDELGQDKLLRPFLTRLARLSKDPAHKVLAGRLALALGRPDLGVRIARHAYRVGIPLMTLAYPIIDMPDGKPERALLLAVARQESNFEPNARSHAGARGLMQLMPATARAVSRSIKTRYSRTRLTTDPAYNIRLGRAYLAALIKQYGGSYVLAIAAYNAGPGAVRRWIRTNGDPRLDDEDVIDWIEAIPYSETRNYVQRVLENLQVYRRRLHGTHIAYSLEQDLRR